MAETVVLLREDVRLTFKAKGWDPGAAGRLEIHDREGKLATEFAAGEVRGLWMAGAISANKRRGHRPFRRRIGTRRRRMEQPPPDTVTSFR